MIKKTILTSLLFASCSYGAGFAVIEQGASNVGTALAGAVTNANLDSSAAFWNPAALSLTDYNEIQSNLNFILPEFNFSDSGTTDPYGNPTGGSNGGNGANDAIVPNMYLMYHVSDDITLGLSVTSTYGLVTEYDDYDWVGRYQALKSRLTTYNFNPSISYKINDRFSVGAGVAIQYLDAALSQYVYTGGPDAYLKLTGDSFGVGANAGFVFNYMKDKEYSEYLNEGRIGFAWRSSVKHSIDDGEATSTYSPLNGTISTEITTPQTLTLGFYQRFLEEFAVMVDVTWTDWSCFKELSIEGAVNESLQEQWTDVMRYSLGFHWYYSEKITWRIGIAFDESPITSSEYTTARIPDCDRIWFSIGNSYKLNENWVFDLAYTYVYMYGSSANVSSTSSGDFVGDYTGHAHVVSASISYRF